MTTELTQKQKSQLTSVFDSFNENDINYVVLRRWEDLPSKISGSDDKELDVDILIAFSDFNSATNLIKEAGYSKTSKIDKGLFPFPLNYIVQDPINTIKTTLTDFESVKKECMSYIEHKQDLTAYQKAVKNKYYQRAKDNNLYIHWYAHLAHKSTLNGKRIRLNPKIENGMLNRKSFKKGLFYAPSPPDELAHIVSHCIFEYQGDFPEYYIQRCEYLKSMMSSREFDIFQDLLEDIYYCANNIVMDNVVKSNYNSIFPKLLKFKDY